MPDLDDPTQTWTIDQPSPDVLRISQAAIELAAMSGQSLAAVLDAIRALTVDEREDQVVEAAKRWRVAGPMRIPEFPEELALVQAVDALHRAAGTRRNDWIDRAAEVGRD